VFVTAGIFTGNFKTQGNALTGLRGADEICQAEAEDGAVPPGQYVAWLSSDTKNAKDRLPDNTDGYILQDGSVVAIDKDDLLDGFLLVPLNLTATGSGVQSTEVWTGTFDGGLAAVNSTCNSWVEANPKRVAAYGLLNATGGAFGWSGEASQPCDGTRRLYCFQR
jgi:hypothetical protein